MPDDDRWLPLQGTTNTRDLGGLPLTDGGTTVSGRVLRSDDLQELTDHDVVVLVDDLGKVVDVVRIARRTIMVAVQSIWVGIGLSVILMLVASFGLIPAIVGAAAQEAVDVATILNGLRATRSGRSPSSDVPPALPARTSDR